MQNEFCTVPDSHAFEQLYKFLYLSSTKTLFMRKRLLFLTFLGLLGIGSLAYSYSVPEATCKGETPCKACKNCKYCKRCAKDGKTCGVCKK